MTKTRMAKSTLDAGWGQLRTLLQYKAKVLSLSLETYTHLTLAEQAGKVEALKEHGANRFTPEVDRRGSYITSIKRGTAKAYLLARLKRDAPAIFAAVERGHR